MYSWHFSEVWKMVLHNFPPVSILDLHGILSVNAENEEQRVYSKKRNLYWQSWMTRRRNDKDCSYHNPQILVRNVCPRCKRAGRLFETNPIWVPRENWFSALLGSQVCFPFLPFADSLEDRFKSLVHLHKEVNCLGSTGVCSIPRA